MAASALLPLGSARGQAQVQARPELPERELFETQSEKVVHASAGCVAEPVPDAYITVARSDPSDSFVRACELGHNNRHSLDSDGQ